MKAGGGYVPLDVTYPLPRLAYMLEDAGAPVVVTSAGARGRVPAGWVQVLDLDADADEIARAPASSPADAPKPGDLAYVIYTSGSTGQPKGVGVSHANLWHSTRARALVYGEPVERYLLLSSLAFDSSVAGVFWSLTDGGALHMPAEGTRSDPAALRRQIARERITHALCLPSLHEAILASCQAGSLAGLRVMIVAGERCPATLAVAHANAAPRTQLYNEYGPTEGSVWSTVWTPDAPGHALGSVPIGRPIPNTRLYILDAARQPVPIDVAGEIYLGGDGITRGYLRRAALTAERFVPDAVSGLPGQRLYRTGDRARWRDDGQVEFLGRRDEQVKLRGYRIELGEVQAALRTHRGVTEAAAIVRQLASGGAWLVGYVTGSVDGRAVREALRAHLPEFIVPGAVVVLDAFPRTPNGKIDRAALPAPGDDGDTFAPPRTAVEEIVAGIWARVLGRASVGIHDNFFTLGGHSLLAVQMIAHARQALGVEVPMRVLFETPTVAAFAASLDRMRAPAVAPPLTRAVREAPIPLSYAQQRLWFEYQAAPDAASYNVPLGIRLRGPVDLTALQRSLTEIVRRHEVLRTRFPMSGLEPVQEVTLATVVPLPVMDLRSLAPAAWDRALRRISAAEAARPFDLTKGPVMRAQIARGAHEHVFQVTLHHIATDGWSMRLLIDEFSALYAAYTRGIPSPLPEPPLQYADFALWQRAWLRDAVLADQLAYWRQQLAGAPLLDVPTDRPRESHATLSRATLTVTLDAGVTGELRTLSQREGVTLFMTLLAAFQIALGRWTGQTDVVVGTDAANRTFAETESLIGFFINQLALRTSLGGNPTAREVLARVRETALGAYAHQDVPFEQVVETLSVARDADRAPVFQHKFVLQTSTRRAAVPGAARAPAQEAPAFVASPIAGEADDTREPAGDAEIALASKLDLELLLEDAASVHGFLHYDPALFDRATMARFVERFTSVLRQMAREPDGRLADFDVEAGADTQAEAEVGALAAAFSAPLTDLDEEEACP
jgi:amino acid adenylation domain-containing protein